MITVGFKTDKGKKRSDNEDSLFVIPDKKIFIVADGVGGQNSGELASRMTVGYMAQFVCLNPIEEAKTGSELKSYFMKLFSGANSLVHEKATSEKSNYGMATTTVLCYIRENTAYFVNVGDSRAYLIRDGRSYQVTEDHSFVQTMIREGHLTKEEAEKRADKNMITRAIGGEEEVHPDFFTLDLFQRDTIILCTDGLHGEVDDDTMTEIVSSASSMHELATELVDKANEAGGRDNISVVCIRIQ